MKVEREEEEEKGRRASGGREGGEIVDRGVIAILTSHDGCGGLLSLRTIRSLLAGLVMCQSLRHCGPATWNPDPDVI